MSSPCGWGCGAALCKPEPVDFLGGRAGFFSVLPKAQPAFFSAVAVQIFFFFLFLFFFFLKCDFIRKVSAWRFCSLPGLGRQFIPSVSTRAALQNCIIHIDPYAAQNS